MPIEIRELIIKATVSSEGDKNSKHTGGNKNNVTPSEEMLNQCIEKIIEIKNEKYER